MGKRLVLIGGGHAHMVTLANLHIFIEKGYEVTVIGPSPYHYYSGMGPGMLSKIYRPEEIRFATKLVVEKQGGRFVLGKAVQVDPAAKNVHLADGTTLAYDVLSCNAGSYVPRAQVKFKGEGKDVFSVKPIEKLLEAQSRLLALSSERNITVAIIGGGPSSIEMAGNTWRLLKDFGQHRATIQIFAGTGFMKRYPLSVRHRAYASLVSRGVEILESSYVKEVRQGQIILESGLEFSADFIFLALGVKPSPLFQESGLPTGPDGGLLVNEYLQCTKHPEIFGGGDCIYFEKKPLDKVGVYAVRQNKVLYHNLLAALEGGALEPFDPGGDYLLIFNMGDGSGIFRKRWLEFNGRFAFLIKDYIDRKFMRKFQAIE